MSETPATGTGGATTVAGATSPSAPAGPPEAPPRSLPGPVATAAAAGGGAGMLLSFPPYDLWWLAPVAVAMLAVAVHHHRVPAGAALGGLTGLVLFVPLLRWTDVEVGIVPWLLLSILQAAYVAVLGGAAAYLSPLVDRWRWSWPLLTAMVWVGQEALRSRTPFGGFPWGRLAFSQTDSPLLPVAAWGGAPLVTFAVALSGGLLAAALWRPWQLWHSRLPPRSGQSRRSPSSPSSRRPRRSEVARHAAPGSVALVVAAGAVVLAGLVVPTAGGTPARAPAVTVAVVQGNVPRLGLDFNAQRRAVLDNHVDATLGLAADVAAGRRPAPDLVVWPENSSDIDPVANPDARARIDAAADAIGAPILVGAIQRGPGDEVRNVGLVWEPGTGPGERYVKRHPVPFAEYLPLEPVVRPIARAITDEVDRVAGFVPGDEPGVLRMGPAVVGGVICFEVAYDTLVRDTVTGGAQLLVVQTNNATFDEAEARQQLAMVRLRAVEHGRESLMASTVGISAFVAVDGRVSGATGFFTRDVLVRTLALSDSRTVATTVGVWPELVLATGAAAALVVGALVRRRSGTWKNETSVEGAS